MSGAGKEINPPCPRCGLKKPIFGASDDSTFCQCNKEGDEIVLYDDGERRLVTPWYVSRFHQDQEYRYREGPGGTRILEKVEQQERWRDA